MSETRETTDSRRQTAETELLPCPFCGATEERTADIVTAGKYQVMLMNAHDMNDEQAAQDKFPFSVLCVECGIRTPDFKTEAEAIAAWNRRAAPVAEWTKEMPTEEGFYACAIENEIRFVFIKNYIVWDKNIGTVIRYFIEKHPTVRWFKLNVPALPEEGGQQ